MNPITATAGLAAILGAAFAAALPGMQDPKDPVAKELRAVIDANLDAGNKRDVDAYMATVHPKSPGYDATRTQLDELNKQYEVTYKILSYSYMGKDAEYAVARVRQETKKVKGPEFRDNDIDTIQVFRKDKDTWKIWSSAMLEVKFHE